MSSLLPEPELFLTLVALTAAAGVDLFWVLFLLAIAARVTWLATGPGSLAEVGGLPVLLFSAGLHTLERCAEALPRVALFWHSTQVVARPVAGALLGVAIVPDPVPAAVVAASTGAVLAAAAHRAVWGADLRRWLSGGRPPGPVLAGVAEDVVVAGLVVLGLEQPEVAGALVAVALLALLVRGRSLLVVARFGLHLAWGWAGRLAGRRGWRSGEDLPEWVREAVRRGTAPGGAEELTVRGVPAGATDPAGEAPFRSGWLVSVPERSIFVVRSGGEGRARPLAAAGRAERCGVFDRLPVVAGPGEGGEEEEERVLHVAVDGPDLDAVAADLARRSTDGGERAVR